MSGSPYLTAWWLVLLGVAGAVVAGALFEHLVARTGRPGDRLPGKPAARRGHGGCAPCRADGLRRNGEASAVLLFPLAGTRRMRPTVPDTRLKRRPRAASSRKSWSSGTKASPAAFCGKPFGEIEWAGQKPALIRADKISVEWSHVPAEQLTETLETALPVCFACHMANTLVRERPDLVIDRSCRTVLKH